MERYLTEKEAAFVTGFSRYWFQKKRVEGGGPPFMRIGASIRYPAAELVEWMNSFGIVSSTSQQPRGPRKQEPDERETIVISRRSAKGIRKLLIGGIPTPFRKIAESKGNRATKQFRPSNGS